MATVTKKLLLDVSRKNLLPNIVAKQYDTDSRFLTVQLLDEGQELKAETGSTVIISFRRADGQAKSFAGTANEDGTVTVPIANWALELDDIVECDISVYRGEAKLSTTTFKLEVQPAANGNEEISEDEDYDILKQLIVEVKTATDAANTAAAEANKWKNVSATAKGLEAGAAPTVSLSDTESGKALSFGIPKGDKGEKGDPGLINGVRLNGEKVEPDAESVVDIKAYNEDNKPEVGGRNLLLNSGVPVSNSNYKLASYNLTEEPEVGEICTITLKGNFGSDRTTLRIFDKDTATIPMLTAPLANRREGIFTSTFTWTHTNPAQEIISKITGFSVYLYPNGGTSQSEIEWIKLERGEIATDWTPAPEDLEPTADNFEGILPIEKGGTGYGNGTGYTSEAFNAETFRSISGIPDDKSFIMPARYDGEGDETVWRRWSSGIKFGCMDSNGYINVQHDGPKVIVGGGTSDSIFWHKILAFNDDEISQFSGILPVEKGGTGNAIGMAPRLNIEKMPNDLNAAYKPGIYTCQSKPSSIIGAPNNDGDGALIILTSEQPYSETNAFPIQIFIDGYTAHAGELYIRCSLIEIPKDASDWTPWYQYAKTTDITPTQLALASLYESREALKTSAVQSDTAMSSPTFDGELSALDRNMISVYADLCLNPDSGKTVDSVPENLRAYVSDIVEKTLAERKEAEEKYKEEMEKRKAALEAEARRKAELEAEPEPSAEKEGMEES